MKNMDFVLVQLNKNEKKKHFRNGVSTVIIAFALAFQITYDPKVDYIICVYKDRRITINQIHVTNILSIPDLREKLRKIGYKILYKNNRLRINKELHFRLKLCCTKENPYHLVELE